MPILHIKMTMGLVALCAGAVFAMACHRAPQSAGVRGGVVPPAPKAMQSLSESALSETVVCADSLGRTDGRFSLDRCTPCAPFATLQNADLSLRHARGLWRRFAMAPYEPDAFHADCTAAAFERALAMSPNQIAALAELTAFGLASSDAESRVKSLVRFDRALDSLVRAGNTDTARVALVHFALAVWDRTQRQLARPTELPLHSLEADAHHLERGMPRFTILPAIPLASDVYGVSEARWCARLFERVAEWTADPVSRSRWHRMALAPFVTIGDWNGVDVSARRLLTRSPQDSAVLPAVALAAYRTVRRPAIEQPRAMALFDSALIHMPRADSARYDSFDDVLAKDDDEWRYGFMPNDRLTIDARGWAVLDPLWSTPVNEIRLERRARVAEADYRYADRTIPGMSGSETELGRMLIRRGLPATRWATSARRSAKPAFIRGWAGLSYDMSFETTDALWQTVYGEQWTLDRVARAPVPRERRACTSLAGAPTMLMCAEASRADWTGVPFYSSTDTIDVTSARFRALNAGTAGDSVDVYLGARIPLRRFRYANQINTDASDSIGLSAWFASPTGVTIRHLREVRALPKRDQTSWTAQWTTRLRAGGVMHRVEALDAGGTAGARGASILSGDAQVEFPLHGFGISDVLVGKTAPLRDGRSRVASATARRWSDISIVPNGGVVEPGAKFEMVWEVYDLTPAPDGRVRWRVEIRREEGATVRRENMRDVMVAKRTTGSRLIAEEPGAPALAYSRDEAAANVQVDRLSFTLGDARVGRHVLQVTVQDLVSGTSVTRSVSMRVLPNTAQGRETSNAPFVPSYRPPSMVPSLSPSNSPSPHDAK